jgi:glycerol-3-phosphate acyltransferase PlsY
VICSLHSVPCAKQPEQSGSRTLDFSNREGSHENNRTDFDRNLCAAVIGHCWNPFLGWNGGKGVATTSGMLLYLLDWHLMLCLILYPVLRMFGRRMGWKQEGAISSMTTMFVLSTLVLIFKGTESGMFAYATLAIVVVRHRSNIQDILSSAA